MPIRSATAAQTAPAGPPPASHPMDPSRGNPSGVALAIHNACRQVIAQGGDQRTDPAIRLMVTQLSFLVDGNSDLDLAEYQRLVEFCRARFRGQHRRRLIPVSSPPAARKARTAKPGGPAATAGDDSHARHLALMFAGPARPRPGMRFRPTPTWRTPHARRPAGGERVSASAPHRSPPRARRCEYGCCRHPPEARCAAGRRHRPAPVPGGRPQAGYLHPA